MSDENDRVVEILDGDIVIAQIYDLNKSGGVIFPTADAAEMQCGFGQISTPKTVAPHVHNLLAREVQNTSEFIWIMEGSAKVVFYTDKGVQIVEKTLTANMGFIQFGGGHGFEFAADTKYIEVKQGPYYGNSKDKTLLSEI